MTQHTEYDPWLEDLQKFAAKHNVDLHLDKYQYHTYFMRGWSPESVAYEIVTQNKAEITE